MTSPQVANENLTSQPWLVGLNTITDTLYGYKMWYNVISFRVGGDILVLKYILSVVVLALNFSNDKYMDLYLGF